MQWLIDLLHDIGLAQRFILLPTDHTTVQNLAASIDQLLASRDADGILGQIQEGIDPWDGGDSAHRTGVIAFCGSGQDQSLLERFEQTPGIMVRHPKEYPWTNPNNCSRDQLIGFAAGCWRAGKFGIVKRLVDATVARGWTAQNTERDEPGTSKNHGGDPILPQDQMFLRVCAGQRDAHWDLVGQAMLQATIEAIPHQPIDTEINQHLLQAIVCCRLDHFVKFVPDYQVRLNAYWTPRKLQQVADALGFVVAIELKRYEGFLGLAFPPLPMHTIFAVKAVIEEAWDALNHINWWKDPENLLQVAPRLVMDLWIAGVRDAEDLVKYYVDLFPKLLGIAEQLVRIPLLGGSIGIPGLLLGGGSAQQNQQVLEALRIIDAKVSEILKFLHNDLKSVVTAGTLDALSKFTIAVNGQTVTNELRPLVSALRRKPSRDAARDLREVAGKMVSQVNAAIEVSGAAFSGKALTSMLSVLDAGAELLRYSPKEYSEFVRAWATTLGETIKRHALDHNVVDSLAYLLARLPSQEGINDVLRKFDPYALHHLVIWRVQIVPMGPNFSVMPFFAYLHSYTPQNGWEVRATYVVLDDFDHRPSLAEVMARPELRAYTNYAEVAWYTTADQVSGYWEDQSKHVQRRANELTGIGRLSAARRTLDEHANSAQQLVESCKNLAESLVEDRVEPVGADLKALISSLHIDVARDLGLVR